MFTIVFRTLVIFSIAFAATPCRSQDFSPTEMVRKAALNSAADFASLKDYSCEERVANYDAQRRRIREGIRNLTFSNGKLTIYSPGYPKGGPIGASTIWDPTYGVAQISESYDGTMLADKDLNGRSNHVILLKAKSNRADTSYSESTQFPKIEMWVDKQDLRVARIIRMGHKEMLAEEYSKSHGVWLISARRWRREIGHHSESESTFIFTRFTVSSRVLSPSIGPP